MNIKSVVIGLGTSFAISICAAQAMDVEDRKESHVPPHAFDLENVGDEVAITLFDHTDVQSLGRCAQVCQRWNSIVGDDGIWEKTAELYTKTRTKFGFIKNAITTLSADQCQVYNLPTNFGTDSWKTILKNQITYLKDLAVTRKTSQPVIHFEHLSFEDVKIEKDKHKKQQKEEKKLGRPLTPVELLLKNPVVAEQFKNSLPELQALGISTSEQAVEALAKVLVGALENSPEDSSDDSSDGGCTLQ